MSNKKLWCFKHGDAVLPTKCNEKSLRAYHPMKPTKEEYQAVLTCVDHDLFKLFLYGPGWSSAIIKQALRLEFRPSYSEVKPDEPCLVAIAPSGFIFGGFELKRWTIKYEKTSKGEMFIDYLDWESIVSEKELEEGEIKLDGLNASKRNVRTSWRWIH